MGDNDWRTIWGKVDDFAKNNYDPKLIRGKIQEVVEAQIKRGKRQDFKKELSRYFPSMTLPDICMCLKEVVSGQSDQFDFQAHTLLPLLNGVLDTWEPSALLRDVEFDKAVKNLVEKTIYYITFEDVPF